MKKSLCILSICFAAFACCCACKKYNNSENTSDPKTEIANALQAAYCRVYREEIVVGGAKGEAMRQEVAVGRGIVVSRRRIEDYRGGEDEMKNAQVMAIIVFNDPLSEAPDALYLGGENGEEPEKVEKIEWVNPFIAVCEMPASAERALVVKPLLLVEENVDGTPAEEYLVDLKTINVDVSVRRAEDVENNLENFVGESFLRMLRIGRSVRLSSIDQVKKDVSDGPEDPKFSFEPLVLGVFILD